MAAHRLRDPLPGCVREYVFPFRTSTLQRFGNIFGIVIRLRGMMYVFNECVKMWCSAWEIELRNFEKILCLAEFYIIILMMKTSILLAFFRTFQHEKMWKNNLMALLFFLENEFRIFVSGAQSPPRQAAVSYVLRLTFTSSASLSICRR